MTPEEIIKAWSVGKTLEYLGLRVSDVKIRIECENKATQYALFSVMRDQPEIRLKRETFGFDEARRLIESGKIIGKEDLPNRLFRIEVYSKGWQLQMKNVSDATPKWSELYGYPIEWPRSTDFYEVE